MATVEIPIQSAPQSFSVFLSGLNYTMRVYYADVPMGGWLLDIGDDLGNPLANGLSLAPNANIIEQFEYLDMGGKLYVVNDLDKFAMPDWGAFSETAHIVWVEDE